MARGFNGTTDFVLHSTTPDLANFSNITMAGWFFANSFPGSNSTVIAFNGQTAGIFVKSTNVVLYGLFTGTGTFFNGTASVVSGQWYHIALTGVQGGLLSGYVNGAADGTSNAAGSNWGSVTGMVAGGNASSNFTNGNLADTAVWNVVLSAAEVLALAKGARPSFVRPQSLSLWWPLTGIQSPEPDFSGANLNGTLTGTFNAANPPIMQLTSRWPQKLADTTTTTVLELQNFNAFVGRRVAVIGY